ncbi:E3 ubiquitin-protein ligase TRIM7-like [Pyxicephalus adspersus]|uniref:E3 ubiquitin-protein ligase TRIM7-like n=1 Tax=Pyxicephalus adspersus TaxID=30357 RepID=UPI003B5ACDF5
MAAVLLEDLICFICLDSYTDPVSLPCGHSFCGKCIVHELDTQGTSGVYSCPNCRKPFDERPLMLHKKRKLCKEEIVPCTYCDGPVPAEKSCLHCDISLCGKHLGRHSTAPEHVLIEPTAFLEARKCTEHRQILNHYCTDDDVFICLLCYVTGDHEGHEVVFLNTNSAEEEKTNLQLLARTLRKESKKTQDQLNSLKLLQTEQTTHEKDIKKRITGQIKDIPIELNALKERVLNEVSKQQKEVSCLVADKEKKVNEKMEELASKIDQIEKLREIRDPLTFLKNVLGTDLIGIFNVDRGEVGKCMLDEELISQTLHKEVLQFADSLLKQMLRDAFPKMKKSEITLDVKTAHCNIFIADGRRTAIYRRKRCCRDSGPERFQSHQVLSDCSFSSGNHYWEVAVEGTPCKIGVAYSNIERKSTKREVLIGNNVRSWSLNIHNSLSAWHNNTETKISTDSSLQSFGIFLEHEAGRLSFYQLCKPIRHLHTFNANFTEPL